MPIEFRCSICTKLLRVPDEAVGRQAKCPACGNVITIPAGSGAGPEVPPTPEGPAAWQPPPSPGGYPGPPGPELAAPAGSQPPSWPQSAWGATSGGPPLGIPDARSPAPGIMSAQQYQASSRVSPPATWLMVLAILQIAVSVIVLPLFLLGIIGAGVAAGQAGPEGEDQIIELFFNLFFNFFSLLSGLALAIVVLLGAIRMKNLQSYSFAMTAAILSIIPCTSPCCFLIGMPIGIWALVVLNDPAVKAAFR